MEPEIDIELEGLYPTKDIYLASALIAAGFPVITLRKKEKQFTFYLVHQDKEGLFAHEAEERYWMGELQVDGKTLWNAYKELKSRMYKGGQDE